MEVPSPFDGKISSIKVKVGDKVSKGSLIATLSNGDSSKIKDNKSILPETEKIIQEAEKILKKKDPENKIVKEEPKQNFETKVEYKKFTNYSSEQDSIGDVDPQETVEWIESLNGVVERDVLVICLGKSTYARCGIIVNVTPLEPEWEGHVTLEFSNTTTLPAKIYANEGACQFIFLKGDQEPETSYADKKGKYMKQKGVTLPKI